MKAVSLMALYTVVKRHKLEPINGAWHVTDEMVAEAVAIDEMQGVTPPSQEELAAIVEGKEPGWEEVEWEDLE
jgi:hypothetical protein